jgi:predicted nuclease of restriction endonuclease-like (RecB) superfamily
MAGELLPGGYAALLRDLKERIQQAQVRAALAVNRELVLLYWQIGREILTRQEQAGWGARVIDRLAADLRREFPELKGFSPRNLKYMRAVAAAYPEQSFVQQVAAQLPWFHHCVLLDKVRDPTERAWYIQATIAHGWSRSVLVHQIESGLYHRQGRALTNFERTLPAPQSELAQQVLKDPYSFDFLADDQPSIGIVLCKTRNQIVAEYALRDMHKPLGIATYGLTEALPEQLQGSLPTIEQLELELVGAPEPAAAEETDE